MNVPLFFTGEVPGILVRSKFEEYAKSIHPAGISSPADPAFYVLVISVQYMFPALLCPERVPDLIQQLIFIFPDGAVQIFLCICFHARYNLIDINIIPDCPKLRIRKYYFFIFPRSFFIAW